ncbi:S8 family serine peptidase [Patescibacteria group bacterium]|nr:S8 family serine peptidase [Patescibacteria group bacterium]
MLRARYIIIIVLAVAGSIGAAYLGLSSQSTYTPGPEAGEPMEGFERVLITPANSRAERKLRRRSGVDIRHEFNGKFSANVPTAAIPALKKLGRVEDVPIWGIHHHGTKPAAKPICGNGVIEGGEKCGEPGLECPTGQVCERCKCQTTGEEPPPEGRSCFPTDQREYNVVQVNGGQLSAGTGINVAVLDTGTTPDHLDLDVKLCKDATKRGIRGGCVDKSTVAHGTHTTGIVAANGGGDGFGLFGVAPSANLWAIKVCGNQFCFTDDIAAAINFAADQGAHVISLSLGGPQESNLVKEAIANNPGVLFVASAGNSGPGSDTIEFPAGNPAVIAVAAHDNGKIVARFSSRGIDDGDDTTIVEREVELSAGGVTVESTNKDGCYSSLSGTSFSAPTVAGLAAKVWQGSVATTRAFLVSIATDITQANGGGAGVGFDIASGYGLPAAP